MSRRRLRGYPKWFRQEYEDEILGVLQESGADGWADRVDLAVNAVRMRLRPRVTDRVALTAVRLMYVGAVVELVTAVVIAVTMDDVTAADGGQRGSLDSLLASALVAVGCWLWLAAANGHGRRWARLAFGMFFCVNVFGLIHGLAEGSATFAPADLACAVVLCAVQFVAVVLTVQVELRR